MAKHRNNELSQVKIKKTSNIAKEKAELKRRGTQQNYFDSQEPMQISPNGPRFSIEGRKVTYLDWKFNFLVQSSSGAALFNVNLRTRELHMNSVCKKLLHFIQQEPQHLVQRVFLMVLGQWGKLHL